MQAGSLLTNGSVSIFFELVMISDQQLQFMYLIHNAWNNMLSVI